MKKHLVFKSLLLMLAVVPVLSFKSSNEPERRLACHFVKLNSRYYVYFDTQGKTENDVSNRYFSSIIDLCAYQDRYGDDANEKQKQYKKKFLNRILADYEDETRPGYFSEVGLGSNEDEEDLRTKYLREIKSARASKFYNVITIQL